LAADLVDLLGRCHFAGAEDMQWPNEFYAWLQKIPDKKVTRYVIALLVVGIVLIVTAFYLAPRHPVLSGRLDTLGLSIIINNNDCCYIVAEPPI
jgi:hypothetical protein